MNNYTSASRQKVAVTIAVLAVLMGVSACDSEPGSIGPYSAPSATEIVPNSEATTTVSGQVTLLDSGEPYSGAIVEFRTLDNVEFHTETDSSGVYSITLPAGVYNAFALDLEDLNAKFDVVDRADSIVNVPPSTEVSFVASAIS